MIWNILKHPVYLEIEHSSMNLDQMRSNWIYASVLHVSKECKNKVFIEWVISWGRLDSRPIYLFKLSTYQFKVYKSGIANGPEDLGSIPGRVIPKTQKMVLDASLLNTQHYKVRIKGKVEQSREGVAPSPTHLCSSYRKGSLRVTLDYGRQLYLLIYTHTQVGWVWSRATRKLPFQ